MPSIVVVFISQAAGFLPLGLALAFIEDLPLGRSALLWGAAAGVAGGMGVGWLYRALAIGRMSVVAPITGVVAASIPVIFGLFIGERPSIAAWSGVVLALVAVVLVSGGGAGVRAFLSSDPAIKPALGAGAGFGAFFVFLERAGDDAGLWSVLASRTTATTMFLVAVVVTRTSLRVDLRSVWSIAAAGWLDTAAIALYVAAAREGLLSLVAVLSSMYPAMTVLLARVVLKERFVRAQVIGLVIALGAIALIALE